MFWMLQRPVKNYCITILNIGCKMNMHIFWEHWIYWILYSISFLIPKPKDTFARQICFMITFWRDKAVRWLFLTIVVIVTYTVVLKSIVMATCKSRWKSIKFIQTIPHCYFSAVLCVIRVLHQSWNLKGHQHKGRQLF